MKIRIKGNSLRLRLTQGELQRFDDEGRVADEIGFGPEEGDQLIYELVRSGSHTAVSAEFTGGEITVYLPEQQASGWIAGQAVGVEGRQLLKENEHLHILIEKDFQCLHKRAGEDESDLFENPDADDNADSSASSDGSTKAEHVDTIHGD